MDRYCHPKAGQRNELLETYRAAQAIDHNRHHCVQGVLLRVELVADQPKVVRNGHGMARVTSRIRDEGECDDPVAAGMATGLGAKRLQVQRQRQAVPLRIGEAKREQANRLDSPAWPS